MPASSLPGTHYRPLRALLLLVGAQMCFTLLDATGKYLARDMGVPLISLVRHAVHALLMLAFLAPVMGTALLPRAHPKLQLLRGVMLAGFTLFFFTALRYLPQAEATAINIITPFLAPLTFLQIGWAMLAGFAFFGQLPDSLSVIGIAVICVGGAATVLLERQG